MIANNTQVRAELLNRWLHLDLYNVMGSRQTYSLIVTDAMERAPWMKFSKDRFSKWLNNKSGGLTNEQVEWLCTRYGVDVNICIGAPVVKEGIVEFEVQPYNELSCLTNLKEKFPVPAHG